MRAVKTGQRGSYACKARNALGEAASNRVKLDVRCECMVERSSSGILPQAGWLTMYVYMYRVRLLVSGAVFLFYFIVMLKMLPCLLSLELCVNRPKRQFHPGKAVW